MLVSELEYTIKKNLTDGICLAGTNLSHIENLLKRKYVPKREMRKALEDQQRFLQII
jgi:hypothetical protein